MGTGSAFYRQDAKERGLCLHCGAQVRFEKPVGRDGTPVPYVPLVVDEPSAAAPEDERVRWFDFYKCPACSEITVWTETFQGCEASYTAERIFPRAAAIPSETPVHVRKAYDEASKVLRISANAAAALARRALQMMLREELGVEARNLKSEIDAAAGRLPDFLIQGLHELREVGNFALHPSKDSADGTIVETEPGEAELTVELVRSLMHHLYAGREASARLASLREARKRGSTIRTK